MTDEPGSMGSLNPAYTVDPMQLVSTCWPKVKLYNKQKEILYSLVNNDETVVPAGNMLGKDFISGLAVLYFFLSRSPCRVVTTSVDEGQLEHVLWGEINNFIQSSVYRLPLVQKHLDIRKIINGQEEPKSYILGRVAKKFEGLLGHHLPRGPANEPHTLMVYDEASGIDHGFKEKTDTWAHRTLIIGNPFPCENFFKEAVKKKSIPSADGKRFYVNVIKIRAVDSPNVRFAFSQKLKGMPITNKIIVPGVLSYDEYIKRSNLWDKVRKCISLDAEFYEGAESLLYPPDWLNRAEHLARYYAANKPNRKAEAVGVDPAEGGDQTTLAAVDRYGLIKLESHSTPDTSVIPGLILSFARSVGLNPDLEEDAYSILCDLGGGGKQHLDRLAEQGYIIRGVSFGESPSGVDKYARMRSISSRIDEDSNRQIYQNRRAEMYGILSKWLDPSGKEEYEGFGIPEEYMELRRQLAPLPKLWDNEGKLWLPPKHRKAGKSKGTGLNTKTLVEILGRSPDDADALVLATFGMTERPFTVVAGVG